MRKVSFEILWYIIFLLYFNFTDIPIILSFDATIDKCLKRVYDLPAVAVVIDEIKDIIMKYASEINSKVSLTRKF